MAVIAQIKKDIEFNRNLRSLVEVLKSVAAAHYHALERKITSDKKFYEILETFMRFPQLVLSQHPFVCKTDDPLGIIAVTSDSGLLGGLNTRVMNMAFEEFGAYKARLIIVGQKGHALARDRKISFAAFPGVKDEERYAQACAIRDFAAEEILTKKMGALEVIYPHPVNFLVQKVEKRLLLPYDLPKPTREDLATLGTPIIESRLVDIIEYLVFLALGEMFHEVLGFSRLAELSARYTHLENSSQKLQEYEGQLRLKYFRTRHEIIDRSMREIFAARSLFLASSSKDIEENEAGIT